MNYKYNPNCKKVSGIQQHAYMHELKTDHLSDIKIFGQDPFHTKAVNNDRLEAAQTLNESHSAAFNKESNLLFQEPKNTRP